LERRHGFEPGTVGRAIWASEDWELAQLGDLSYDEYWERVGAMLDLSTPEEIAEFRQEYFSGDRLDEDLVSLIRELRSHYKIGLLSNAPDKLDTWLEEDWGIAHLFDAIVYSGKVGLVKPDPRIYQLILGELAIRPAEALFVDDYLPNIEAALALGLAAVRFTDTPTLKKDLRRYVVWDMSDGEATD
jgi:putative hydrolase of the HAD superfamily